MRKEMGKKIREGRRRMVILTKMEILGNSGMVGRRVNLEERNSEVKNSVVRNSKIGKKARKKSFPKGSIKADFPMF
jgi:hypothetical protein